jgi:hypothetical protein
MSTHTDNDADDPPCPAEDGATTCEVIILLANRKAPPVCEQPAVRLRAWRIYRRSDGSRVVAGVLEERDTVRCTTAIVRVDAPSRSVETTSGRKYNLEIPPASSSRLRDVIDAHMWLTDPGAQDVSEEVWVQMAQAAS